MNILKLLFITATAIILMACSKSLPKVGEYVSLSVLTHKGVAKDAKVMQNLEGKRVKVWGYLDSHNISLKQGVIVNQPIFWETGSNSFPLKAYVTDESGQGIWVRVLGDISQYKKVFETLRDVGEKPVKILVDATVKTTVVHYNTSRSLSVYLEVTSFKDIQIQ